MDFLPQFGDNMDQSGLEDPTLQAINLKRKLALADSLKNSPELQGQMVSGHYVKPSWTQSLANAVNKGLGAYTEQKAMKDYAESQKAEKSKLSKAFNEYITGKGPKDITTTQDNFVTQPLQEGQSVATAPSYSPTSQSSEQVGQVAPNYAGQAPVLNMTGDTTVNQPISTTTQAPRTKQELMANALKYINASGNTDLASKAVLGDIENMFKAPETNLGKVEPHQYTPQSVAKFKETGNYNDLQAITKNAAPTVRTMRMGTNEVTQQWNDKTQSWDQIAKGPAFKPTEEISFDPQVLSAMADQALAGDKSVFTNLGRGAQGAKNIVALRTAMNNKMLENGWSGKDIAAKNAEFIGMTSGQRTLGTRTANIEMAGTEFSNMLPLAREASALVPRSGFLPFGKANVMFDEQTNDPALRQFAAANNSLVNVYARAISPSGQPTISDKDHAREMLSTAFDQKSYNATLDQLEKEISAARKSPGQVRESMNRTITGRPEQSTATPGSARSKADEILQRNK